MRFVARQGLSQVPCPASTLGDFDPTDRINLGPAANPRDSWPAWTDRPVELGSIVPELPKGSSQPSRRSFLGLFGSLGIIPATASLCQATDGPGPLERLHRQFMAAQRRTQAVITDQPTNLGFEEAKPHERALATAQTAEDVIWVALVKMIARLGGFDLESFNEDDPRSEFFTEPLVVVREGGRSFALIPGEPGYYSVPLGLTRQCSVFLVVV